MPTPCGVMSMSRLQAEKIIPRRKAIYLTREKIAIQTEHTHGDSFSTTDSRTRPCQAAKSRRRCISKIAHTVVIQYKLTCGVPRLFWYARRRLQTSCHSLPRCCKASGCGRVLKQHTVDFERIKARPHPGPHVSCKYLLPIRVMVKSTGLRLPGVLFPHQSSSTRLQQSNMRNKSTKALTAILAKGYQVMLFISSYK